jgi:CBS domain-containing protein
MIKVPSNLTAADIMQTDVVSAGMEDSLQEAMSLMTENHVTGLPVLDRQSRCAGVVSATDILGFEQDHSEETADANAGLARHFDPESGRWEDVRVTSFALEEFADVPISEVMSHDVISVLPDAPLKTVAQSMVEHEVHRVLVVDGDRYMIGVISTVDFVRLFVDSV